MICPKCKSKLSCQESRQLNDSVRFREYACLKCNVVYTSEEKLDHEILRNKIQESLRGDKRN